MQTTIVRRENSRDVRLPHIPLAQRLKGWDGKPYEVLDEDKEWLEMKSVGDEKWSKPLTKTTSN